MNRAALRKRKAGKFAAIERQLDALLRKRAMERDKGLCQMSLPKKVKADDVHHIFPRSQSKRTRWQLRNAISLSRTWHDLAKSHPVEFRVCMLRRFTQSEWDSLERDANTPLPSPTMEWYEGQRKKLEEAK